MKLISPYTFAPLYILMYSTNNRNKKFMINNKPNFLKITFDNGLKENRLLLYENVIDETQLRKMN